MEEKESLDTIEKIEARLNKRKENKNSKYYAKKAINFGTIALTGITAIVSLTSCNTNAQSNLQAPAAPQQKEIPEIPVAYQNMTYDYKMDYPSDFLSSYENYMKINPDSGRYVDLNNYLTSYIYYEDGLDSEIVEEIKRAASYFESVLKTINSGYSIEVKKGSAKLLSQLFCKDSIFFCKADSDKLKEMESISSSATAITTKSPMTPPKIYINKNNANTIQVNGKRISLNKVILHEMLHGYGFVHTEGQDDIMYYTIGNFSNDSEGRVMFEAYAKKTYVTDYFKFSDKEVRSLIYKFCHAKKDLNITIPMYRRIMGITRASQYDYKAQVDNYVKNNLNFFENSNPGKAIDPSQIISMDSTNKNLRIVLNADYLGMYKAFYKGRVFKGQYFLYETEVNGKSYQTILLDEFQYSSNDKRPLKIVPYRKEYAVDKFQYFKTVSSGINLNFIDSTEKWFKDNNITPQYDIASLLNVEFQKTTPTTTKSQNGQEM